MYGCTSVAINMHSPRIQAQCCGSLFRSTTILNLYSIILPTSFRTLRGTSLRESLPMEHFGVGGASLKHLWGSKAGAGRQGSYSFRQDASQRLWSRPFDSRNSKHHWLVLITFCFMSFAIIRSRGSVQSPSPLSAAQYDLVALERRASNSTALVDFEVSPPVTIPSTACQVTLMEYSFSNSYGHPFVGKCSLFCSYPLVNSQQQSNGVRLSSTLCAHTMNATRTLSPRRRSDPATNTRELVIGRRDICGSF